MRILSLEEKAEIAERLIRHTSSTRIVQHESLTKDSDQTMDSYLDLLNRVTSTVEVINKKLGEFEKRLCILEKTSVSPEKQLVFKKGILGRVWELFRG